MVRIEPSLFQFSSLSPSHVVAGVAPLLPRPGPLQLHQLLHVWDDEAEGDAAQLQVSLKRFPPAG